MIWRKARKKPVVVEFREVQPKTLIRRRYLPLGCKWIEVRGEAVKTREGTLFAYPDEDYIIRGVDGETYPIKITIFNKTYEVLE